MSIPQCSLPNLLLFLLYTFSIQDNLDFLYSHSFNEFCTMLTSKFISSGQLPLLRTSCILNISTSVAQKHHSMNIYQTELSSSSSRVFKLLQTSQLLLYYISYPDHQHHHQQEYSSQKLGVGFTLLCLPSDSSSPIKSTSQTSLTSTALVVSFFSFLCFVRELGNRLFYLRILFLGCSPQHVGS